MIRYKPGGGLHFFLRLVQTRGSVFPRSFWVALPSAVLAAVLNLLLLLGHIPYENDFNLMNSATWTGFSGLLGFLIVFRTSQSYGRYWSGCTSIHQMRAEWFDACSQILAFCQVSKASKEEVLKFKGKLIRLFSMMHAAALAELEEINADSSSLDEIQAFNYQLIDPHGIDEETLRSLKNCPCKVELLFTWVQMLLVESIEAGVLTFTPAIMSRPFQVLSNGMSAFFDAVKVTCIPFPFPYAQTCDLLLVIHWLIAPLVVAQWVNHPFVSAVFVFIQVFVLWALNFIACEIDNPFGTDANDLDGMSMQEEMNRHLMLLMNSKYLRTPDLRETAVSLQDEDYERMYCDTSFMNVWSDLANDGEPVPEPARKGQYFNRGSVMAQMKVLPNGMRVSNRQARPSRHSGGVVCTKTESNNSKASDNRNARMPRPPPPMGATLSSGSAFAPNDPPDKPSSPLTGSSPLKDLRLNGDYLQGMKEERIPEIPAPVGHVKEAGGRPRPASEQGLAAVDPVGLLRGKGEAKSGDQQSAWRRKGLSDNVLTDDELTEAALSSEKVAHCSTAPPGLFGHRALT